MTPSASQSGPELLDAERAAGQIARGACCVGRGGADEAPPPGPRQRTARAAVGLAVSTGGAALATGALAGWWLLWPLALAALWFGASHVVASVTGYRGCPELGAIPSLFLRRPLATRCTPWERFDRVLTPKPPGDPSR